MRITIACALALAAGSYEVAASADAETLSPDMTTLIEQGFAALDDDHDGKIPLLTAIRAVRPLGFGTINQSPTPERGGRGRGGMGSGQRGGAASQQGSSEGRGQTRGSAEEHSHGPGEHSHGPGEHSHDEAARRSVPTSADAVLLVSFDLNRDRLLDLDEIKQALGNDIARQTSERLQIDLDRDGKISKPEFAAQLESTDETQLDEDGFDRRAKMTFEREDVDGDGFITQAEITAAISQQLNLQSQALGYCLLLATVDADRDQKISAAELHKFAQPELAELLKISVDQPLALGDFYSTIRRRLSRQH